jgi:hypothetical protein
MAGSDIREAAARVFGLLSDEERRKRRLTTMMDRLREDGFVEPRPAHPQGTAVADAAQAIEGRLTASDALRAEAERQLASTEATGERSESEFLRSSPGAEVTPGELRAPDDAALARHLGSMPFKRDDSIAEWRWAVPPMTRYLEIDEDMAVQADSDIVPILAGVHAYRHLDRRSKEAVMTLIHKMATNVHRPDLWPLAEELRGQAITAQESPYQSLWSMSGDELRDHIQRQAEFLDIIDFGGDAQDAGELGVIALGAKNIASKLTVPGAVASALLLAAKYATKANKAHLEDVLQNRQNGGNPFDRSPLKVE